MRHLVAAALLLATVRPGAAFDERKLVDLTHPFDATTVYWPTEAGFQLEVAHRGPSAGGWWYAANRFCAAEHGGTHVDAPIHFAEGRHAVDALPLQALVGPAVVVDVGAQAAADRDYRVQVADLAAWETRHGRIPDGAIVVMRSGWARLWPDKARYLGTAVRGDTANLHFPGFAREAAEWLLRERRIDALGVDTPSLDHGPSSDFPVHRVVAARDVPGIENLADLDRLPEHGATLLALPMKIGGGTGAPVRVVALLP